MGKQQTHRYLITRHSYHKEINNQYRNPKPAETSLDTWPMARATLFSHFFSCITNPKTPTNNHYKENQSQGNHVVSRSATTNQGEQDQNININIMVNITRFKATASRVSSSCKHQSPGNLNPVKVSMSKQCLRMCNQSKKSPKQSAINDCKKPWFWRSLSKSSS